MDRKFTGQREETTTTTLATPTAAAATRQQQWRKRVIKERAKGIGEYATNTLADTQNKQNRLDYKPHKLYSTSIKIKLNEVLLNVEYAVETLIT